MACADKKTLLLKIFLVSVQIEKMIFYTIFNVCMQTVQYLWRGLTARKLRHGMFRQKNPAFKNIFSICADWKNDFLHYF